MIPRQIFSNQPRHFGRGRSGQRLMTGIPGWQKLAPAAADGIPSLQMLSRCSTDVIWLLRLSCPYCFCLFNLLIAVNLSSHWFICWFICWMNVTNASGWLFGSWFWNVVDDSGLHNQIWSTYANWLMDGRQILCSCRGTATAARRATTGLGTSRIPPPTWPRHLPWSHVPWLEEPRVTTHWVCWDGYNPCVGMRQCQAVGYSRSQFGRDPFRARCFSAKTASEAWTQRALSKRTHGTLLSVPRAIHLQVLYRFMCHCWNTLT